MENNHKHNVKAREHIGLLNMTIYHCDKCGKTSMHEDYLKNQYCLGLLESKGLTTGDLTYL